MPIPVKDNFEYQFTVFTATYNRAHTLHRVFDSLNNQTYNNFEWLIGDDGSEDNTESIVKGWVDKAKFSIRYFRINHAGKHFVYNKGVRLAKGRYFLEVDSDDAIKPIALERAKFHWDQIPKDSIKDYFIICFACESDQGERIGNCFPQSPIDYDYRTFNYSKEYRSEKLRCIRTETLHEKPFKESNRLKDTLIPESIVFCEIAKNYKARFSNEILRIYYQDVPSLCRNPVHPMINLEGLTYAILYTLNNDLDFLIKSPYNLVVRISNYARFSMHLDINLIDQFSSQKKLLVKFIWILFLPFSVLRFLFDIAIKNTPKEANKAKLLNRNSQKHYFNKSPK